MLGMTWTAINPSHDRATGTGPPRSLSCAGTRWSASTSGVSSPPLLTCAPQPGEWQGLTGCLGDVECVGRGEERLDPVRAAADADHHSAPQWLGVAERHRRRAADCGTHTYTRALSNRSSGRPRGAPSGGGNTDVFFFAHMRAHLKK